MTDSPDADTPVVAVIGLGAMGSRLAANLLAEGLTAVVANRSAAAAEPLIARGAQLAASAREAADRSDVVIVAVTDDDASRQVWTEGEHALLQGVSPGQVVIECSTVSPGWVSRLGLLATERGARFLEAPMVGSRAQVEGRTLVHLIGGDLDSLDAVRHILDVSARTIHHCGPVGTAATTKLVVNALLAVQVAAAAELLGVVAMAGLSAEATLSVLSTLPVASPAFLRTAGLMLARNYAAQFTTDLVIKDLRYLQDLAVGTGAAVPLAGTTLAGFESASAGGHGADDITAIAALFLP